MQCFGVPGAQPNSAKGQEGSVWDMKEKKKGKKRHWEPKKAQTCQTPSFVLRPNLQDIQNQTKPSVLYPNAGNHLPRGFHWDFPGEGKSHLSHQPLRADIPLFLSVFHLFAFSPLFLLVQGVELRCPQSARGWKIAAALMENSLWFGFFFS